MKYDCDPDAVCRTQGHIQLFENLREGTHEVRVYTDIE